MKKEKIQKISHEVINFGESKGLTENSYIGEWIDAAVEYMLRQEPDKDTNLVKQFKTSLADVKIGKMKKRV